MTLITLPFTPSYYTKVMYAPRLLEHKFENSDFTIAAKDGINTDLRTYNVVFSNISNSTANNIINFFNENSVDIKPFEWVGPDGSPGFYTCKTWKKTYDGSGTVTITCTFNETAYADTSLFISAAIPTGFEYVGSWNIPSTVTISGTPYSVTGARISHMMALSDSIIIVAGGLQNTSDAEAGLVLKSSDSGISWTDITPAELRTTNTGVSNRCTHIAEVSDGFIVFTTQSRSGNTAFKTINLGSTWTPVLQNLTGLVPYNIFSTAYVRNTIAISRGESLAGLVSTDSGATWTELNINLSATTSYSNRWMSVSPSTAYKSSNGTIWTAVTPTALIDVSQLVYDRTLDMWMAVGYASGPDNASIAYSRDAGVSWSIVTVVPTPISPEYIVTAASSNYGHMIVSDGNGIHVTTNGSSWTKIADNFLVGATKLVNGLSFGSTKYFAAVRYFDLSKFDIYRST